MSVSTVVSQGYGSFGGVNFLPTLGYSSGEDVSVTTILTTLEHSPADILRHLLIDLGKGSEPQVGGIANWPIFTAREPDLPDNCITTFDRDSIVQGRIHYTGEIVEFYGVQVRVRATGHEAGYVKANQLAVALDQDVLRETVIIEGATYFVQSVTRRSGVTALGKEPAGRGRVAFTFSVIASLYQYTES